MIPTRAVMELIDKATSALIEAKYALIEAERIASSIEEKTYIVAIQKRVQEGIKEILHTFFPKIPFDSQAWLNRRTSRDAEHDAKIQKILDDAVATGAFDAKEWVANVTKSAVGHSANLKEMLDSAAQSIEENDIDSDDPDSPNYRKHTDDYPCHDDGHELITGK